MSADAPINMPYTIPRISDGAIRTPYNKYSIIKRVKLFLCYRNNRNFSDIKIILKYDNYEEKKKKEEMERRMPQK